MPNDKPITATEVAKRIDQVCEAFAKQQQARDPECYSAPYIRILALLTNAKLDRWYAQR